MYPYCLEKLVSYWTARKSRMSRIDKIVMFVLQRFVNEYIIKHFNENFFEKNINDIINEFESGPYRVFPKTITSNMTKRIKKLHELDYLLIEIKNKDGQCGISTLSFNY